MVSAGKGRPAGAGGQRPRRPARGGIVTLVAGSEPETRLGDPAAGLSPTAQRLVAAARRLLARGGVEALTVEAVAAEAGVYRDAVRYHFGSKAAFLAAVVDSLTHDQSLRAYEESRRHATGSQRVRSLLAGDRGVVADQDAFRDYFLLVPLVIRDPELRERVARLYDWYRELYVEGLAGSVRVDRDTLELMASLMVAMTDGLALQKLLDPGHVDLESLFELWERILRRELLGEDSGE